MNYSCAARVEGHASACPGRTEVRPSARVGPPQRVRLVAAKMPVLRADYSSPT